MYDSKVTDHRGLRVLVHSDDRSVRSAVIAGLGRSLHPDLPDLEYVECATADAVMALVDGKGPGRRPDLLILDGEAAPAGGMGIARQLKDEIFDAPAVVLLVGRAQDAWLASWSRAEATVTHPIEPMDLAETVLGVARRLLAHERS